jgi:hypothetical protein
VTVTLLKDQWRVAADEEDHRRRSVYLFVRRNLRYPLFDVFDRPDTNASCPARHESTTGTQSLVLFNSEFSLDCARALAATLAKENASSASAQIRGAYVRILSREPNAEEIRLAGQFLTRQVELLKNEKRGEGTVSDTAAALADFCLALFNASEFVYVD